MWNKPPDIHSQCKLADGLESTQHDMESHDKQHLLLLIFLLLPLYHTPVSFNKPLQTAQWAFL